MTTNVPLGILTFSGFCDVYLLVHGAADGKKLILQPESSIDVLSVAKVNTNGVHSKIKANGLKLQLPLRIIPFPT
jgi:hypothetical protein